MRLRIGMETRGTACQSDVFRRPYPDGSRPRWPLSERPRPDEGHSAHAVGSIFESRGSDPPLARRRFFDAGANGAGKVAVDVGEGFEVTPGWAGGVRPGVLAAALGNR